MHMPARSGDGIVRTEPVETLASQLSMAMRLRSLPRRPGNNTIGRAGTNELELKLEAARDGLDVLRGKGVAGGSTLCGEATVDEGATRASGIVQRCRFSA